MRLHHLYSHVCGDRQSINFLYKKEEKKNMKKRLLSMLMAMCLMATMVPAAFAAETDQPDTITLPNGEVREIPTVEFPDAPATLAEIDSSEVIQISSPEDLMDIGADEWYSGKTFEITADLNLSDIMKDTPEWDGYIRYFYGNMIGKKADGSAPVISGIPNNRGFIYGIVGGTIENLTFKHDASKENGSASFITFMPTKMTGATQHLTMNNITVTGDISLTGSDQSNYSPFVYAAPSAGLTMENCTNDAKITGSIYGSVFHGYYALFVGESAPYQFINCVNNGDVTLLYAGMFFGNSSSLEGKVGRNELYLTIADCENNGKIRGTAGARYFAAPVSEFGSGMDAVEDMIKPLADGEQRAETQSPYAIEPVVLGEKGALYEGHSLDGFSATLNGYDITVNCPSDAVEAESGVAYYMTSVSTYVNAWDSFQNIFNGTDRVTVSQRMGVNAIQNNSFEPTLKAYGFVDENVGTHNNTTISGEEEYKVYTYDGGLYYQISNKPADTGFANFVSNKLGENGKPIGGGAKNAEIVTISAFKENGTMIDSITLLPKEA